MLVICCESAMTTSYLPPNDLSPISSSVCAGCQASSVCLLYVRTADAGAKQALFLPSRRSQFEVKGAH